MLISFLPSGSVIKIEEIPAVNLFIKVQPNVITLPYGGYLVAYDNAPGSVDSCILTGYILDDNETLNSNWSFPYIRLASPCIVFYSKNNNDVHIISEITSNKLTIITSNIPKFIDDGKLKYLILT